MLRQRFIPVVLVGIVLSLFAGDAQGGTVVVHSTFRRARSIAHPIGCRVCVRPVHSRSVRVSPHHRKVIVTGHHHNRFVRIWPRCHNVVVARHPHVRHIVANPRPTVVVRSHPKVVEHMSIIVWITNSNGSKTSVKLRKSGPGYLGPRGEWYPSMPTNNQLRVVYGF
jgi:hypothetical protein